MNEAENARVKLDMLCDELRGWLPMNHVAWDHIDGIYADIGRLERKAYLIIRVPRFLQRRRSAAV